MSKAISEETFGTASAVEPAVKKLKSASQTTDALAFAPRTLKIRMLCGDEFEVSVPGNADVGDLEAAVAKQTRMGPCFTLVLADGQLLNDITAPLPREDELFCHIEDISELPSAAQVILNKVFGRGFEDPKKLNELRLGRCRIFGCFPVEHFSIAHFTAGGVVYFMHSDYEVMEFTLIDGANKRLRFIAVINSGRSRPSSATDIFGHVYSRPGLKRIATIRPYDTMVSKWSIYDDCEYKAPSDPLQEARPVFLGARRNVASPFTHHLAHAFEAAHHNASRRVQD